MIMKKDIYDYMPEIIGQNTNPIIFEIGSSTGLDTAKLSQIKGSFIHAFECDPRCKYDGFPTNVRMNKFAVTNNNGLSTFIQSDTKNNVNIYSSSLLNPKNHLTEHKHVQFDNQIFVKTTTLDFYCKTNDIKNISFLWIDVQGAEYNVFEGANEILKKTKWIYTEYSDFEMYEGQKPLLELLKILKDFIVIDIWSTEPSNVLLRNKKI